MLGKVFKTGNITVISIPSEMLESLGLGDGSDVSVELDAAIRQIVIHQWNARFPEWTKPLRVRWPISSKNTALLLKPSRVNIPPNLQQNLFIKSCLLDETSRK